MIVRLFETLLYIFNWLSWSVCYNLWWHDTVFANSTNKITEQNMKLNKYKYSV